jgi:hypothetical protein
MKLEILPDGSPDCPLLRLFDFTPSEAGQLHDAIAGLASGSNVRADVHHLPAVKPIGGCALTLVVSRRDQGVLRKAGPAEFVCGFTAVTWDNVAGLIEPFTVSGCRGYQWLAEAPGEVAVLLSIDGKW